MNFDHDTGLIESVLTIDTTVPTPTGSTTGSLIVIGTGSLYLPTGTTAQRPANSIGMQRFNTTLGAMEYNDGTVWTTLSTTGGTVSSVAVSGSTGLSVSGSPITTTGTITLTLDSGLQTLASLATTGVIVQSAADTFVSRTITGTAGNISITNGNGVSGNPTIDLATAGTAVTASHVKITTDAFGRVTATTPVVAGDITTLVDGSYINVTGDSMNSAANLTFSGGGEVLGLPATPTSAGSAASKAYVDSLVQGLDPKPSVRVATTAAGTLATSFENGDTVDGITLATGNRILIKNQAAPAENGVYLVNATGAPTRASDFDNWLEVPGAFVFVEQGTTNADTGWVSTADQGGTLGTTAITFTQFSGAGTYTAGTGLTLSGTQFSLTTPVTAANGGTGLNTSTAANGQLLIGNGTGLSLATLTQGTGITITNGSGTITIANSGVLSVSGGTTGLTPNTATTGAVTLAGTLVAANGGTGQSTYAVGDLLYASGTAALSRLASGTTGQVLTANGAAAPSWAAGNTLLNLYRENSSTPTTPTATGTNAVAIGTNSNATAVDTFAVGNGSVADLYGSKAFANGVFASDGDAQNVNLIVRNVTTNATTTELFLDGASAQMIVPNNAVWTFDINVSARRTDAVGGAAGYSFAGVIRKDATPGTVTFVGTPSKVVLGETNAAWNANVTIDTGTGALSVDVTGEAAKTIRWVATANITQVTN